MGLENRDRIRQRLAETRNTAERQKLIKTLWHLEQDARGKSNPVRRKDSAIPAKA